MKNTTLYLLLAFFLISEVNLHSTPKAEYGTAVNIPLHETVDFPDFSIRYFGIKELEYPEQFLKPVPTYLYSVQKAGEPYKIYIGCVKQGEVQPKYFSFGLKNYVAEIHMSWVLPIGAAKIPEGNLIIWEEPTYTKLRKEKHNKTVQSTP